VSTAWIVAYAVLAGGLVLLALLVIGLLRRTAYVLEQAESHLAAAAEAGGAVSGAGGLPPGAEVPDAFGAYPGGAVFSTSELRGRGSIMLFLTSTCAPCKQLARELRRKSLDRLSDMRLIAVVRDERERDALRLERVEVIYQPDFALARAFETSTSPHAFAIDVNGVVVARSTPNTLAGLGEVADSVRSESDAGATTRPMSETR
jgi:hypothetical protein